MRGAVTRRTPSTWGWWTTFANRSPWNGSWKRSTRHSGRHKARKKRKKSSAGTWTPRVDQGLLLVLRPPHQFAVPATASHFEYLWLPERLRGCQTTSGFLDFGGAV